MESIVSTFVGMFFPHTIEIDEASEKVYFLLYESYSARYSVKVIADKDLVERTLKAYDPSWDFISITSVTHPLLIVATGLMAQQPSTSGFLGRAVEEKFHIKPFILNIIPCIPMVAERLKDMVHPEVGPTQIGTGAKEGYFFVNLSLNQNFDNEPEFYTTTAADEELNEYEAAILDNLNNNEKQYRHDDDDEIPESPERYEQDVRDSYSDNGSIDLFSNAIVGADFNEGSEFYNDYENLHDQINELGGISVEPRAANILDKKLPFIRDSDNDSNGSVSSEKTIKQITIPVNPDQFSDESLDNNYSDTVESNEYDSTSSITRLMVDTSIYAAASESPKNMSDTKESQRQKKYIKKKDKQPIISNTKMQKKLKAEIRKGKQIASYIYGDEYDPLKDSADASSPLTFSGYMSDRSYDNFGASSSTPYGFELKPIGPQKHAESSGSTTLPDFNTDASNSEYHSSRSNTPSKRQHAVGITSNQPKKNKKIKITETSTAIVNEEAIPAASPIIRGRGRPKKIKDPAESENANQIKKPRGRPKKQLKEPQTGEINKYFFKFAFSKDHRNT